MSARPCRLCFGTGVRYQPDESGVADLVAVVCPCLAPIARAYADAVDERVRAMLAPGDE